MSERENRGRRRVDLDMSLRDEVAAIEAMVKRFVNGDVFVQPTISLCRRHISQRSNYCLMRNRGPIVRIAGERHRVTSIDSKCDINLEKYNPTITIVLYCTGLDFPGPGPNFLK